MRTPSLLASACIMVLVAASSAQATCPASPRPLCREFAQSQARIDVPGARFEWKARKAPAAAVGDFGVPTTTSNLSVCAWDDRGLVLSIEAAAGAACGDGPCWKATGSTGWRYNDRDGAAGTLRRLHLKASSRAKTRIRASAALAPPEALPTSGTLVLQLLRDDSPSCFESTLPATSASANDAVAYAANAERNATAPVAPLPGAGCGGSPSPWIPGTPSIEAISHQSLARSFRVWLPPSYDDDVPTPVVFLMHGGFGSGEQVETSSRMLAAATAAGFIVVSPDGLANPSIPQARTWNGGGCCGYAASNEIDDVGFVGAMLDVLEQDACVDLRRVHATGMSNGSMMSHRLACDLGHRIRAVATVAGTDMTESCRPARPVPVLSIHGTDDANVPVEGGYGCGLSGVSYRSLEATLQAWQARDGCAATLTSSRVDGDAACFTFASCSPGGVVESCVIVGGGHQWPGGEPLSTSGLGDCPFGYQSQLYPASERILEFFEGAAPR